MWLRNDYKLSYFPQCSVIFATFEVGLKNDFFSIAHLSFGYHKNQGTTGSNYAWKSFIKSLLYSPDWVYHTLLGPTIKPDVYDNYCTSHNFRNYCYLPVSPGGQGLCLPHLCVLSSQSLASLRQREVWWVTGWMKAQSYIQNHLLILLAINMRKAELKGLHLT